VSSTSRQRRAPRPPAAPVEAVVPLARRLVDAPSPNPPGDERAIAAEVAAALAELALPSPQVLARSARRPNLLTALDFGAGGRHLCFSGHLDTKPIGDARWTVPSDRATLEGDRLYGRGAVDMKGAIAAMIVAAARLAADPPTCGRLSLLFTADEEDGAAFGAHFVAAEGLLAADGVVIGDAASLPADFAWLHLVSRGIARFRIEEGSDHCHSSLCDRTSAINASVEFARLLVACAYRGGTS
jgi:acetylornithine deacetylase/succinyl-diaminopimelate desuccinylase-like protein